jgi:ABC-type Fe3+/spermidine/putrescine transport system ATPase subunit
VCRLRACRSADWCGRTNLLTGKRAGDTLEFDGFSVPLSRLSEAVPNQPEVAISVRPQALTLHRSQPPANGHLTISGIIADRSFLGENWNYQFQAAGATQQLKVIANPTTVFEVGAQAWMEVDVSQFVPLS